MNTRPPGYRYSPELSAAMKARRDAWRASHQREPCARTVVQEGAPLSVQALVTLVGLRLVNGKVG